MVWSPDLPPRSSGPNASAFARHEGLLPATCARRLTVQQRVEAWIEQPASQVLIDEAGLSVGEQGELVTLPSVAHELSQ